MLSVKSCPVPKPCGILTSGPYIRAQKRAMAFKPTLLSNADVIH